MEKKISLNGKLISITISDVAQKHLRNTPTPLLIEVELYFSCLIKKICRFREIENVDDYVRVIDGLYINFRATMANKCSIEEFDKDRVADFPILNQRPYIPKWVIIDYAGNEWAGEFGYAE